MSKDLRFYITDKKDYFNKMSDELLESSGLLTFYRMLDRCFSANIDFLEDLFRNLDCAVLEDGLLNDDFLSMIDFHYHFYDYDISADEILLFIVNCLIPNAEIIEIIIRSDSFDDYDDYTNRGLILQTQNEILTKLKQNVRIPKSIKKELTKWIKEDYPDFAEMLEFVNLKIVILSGEYIYKIYNDDELREKIENVFFEWGWTVDENKKTCFLWYGIIHSSEDVMGNINLSVWEEANAKVKEKFNLDYDNKHIIINQIKERIKLLYANVSRTKAGNFIDSILNAFESKKEVIF